MASCCYWDRSGGGELSFSAGIVLAAVRNTGVTAGRGAGGQHSPLFARAEGEEGIQRAGTGCAWREGSSVGSRLEGCSKRIVWDKLQQGLCFT